MGTIKTLANTNLKASTLIEVLVSLTIITALFSISLMIYLNIIRSEKNEMRLQASQTINLVIQSPELLENNNYSNNSISVILEESAYQNSSNLILRQYTAFDASQKEILSIHKIDILQDEI